MKKPPKQDIFADRRSKRAATNNNCRRIDDFEQAALDLRPWWLKVDYVNQHMSLDNKSSNAPPKS